MNVGDINPLLYAMDFFSTKKLVLKCLKKSRSTMSLVTRRVKWGALNNGLDII